MHAQVAKENNIVTDITSGNTDGQLRLLMLSAFCVAFTITFIVMDYSNFLLIVLLVQLPLLAWLNYTCRHFYDLLLMQDGRIIAKNFWGSIPLTPSPAVMVATHKFPFVYTSNPFLDVQLQQLKITVKMPEKFLLTEDLSAEYVSKLELLLRQGW